MFVCALVSRTRDLVVRTGVDPRRRRGLPVSVGRVPRRFTSEHSTNYDLDSVRCPAYSLMSELGEERNDRTKEKKRRKEKKGKTERDQKS